MRVSVCVCVCVRVCVCLSVRYYNYLRNYTSNLHQILCIKIPTPVARSSSGAIVICYVLPWMTSCLLISQCCLTLPPNWSAAHTQPWAWLETVRSNTSCRSTDTRDYFRALKVTSQVATLGAETAVYDCLIHWCHACDDLLHGLGQCGKWVRKS